MIVLAFVGFLVIFLILSDAFETIVLPRRVARHLRLTRVYFTTLRKVWLLGARGIRRSAVRENYLSLFGPLALLLLIVTWAVGLIFGFALVQWGSGAEVTATEGTVHFGTHLYLSGTTFFTLGLGDITPRSSLARAILVVESGTGFIFLALVIGYLPVLYQAFSRREREISMLDEWAGSPPSAGALLMRLGQWGELEALGRFLSSWEAWAADVLESHISYPILAGFRSQHGNQSWLGGLTMVLDACALILSGVQGTPRHSAWLTFAMARHAVVDLCQVLESPPRPPDHDRLPPEDLRRLHEMLATSGVALADGAGTEVQLRDLRALYEPYVNSLAERLLVPLPAWLPTPGAKDNWQKSAWK